MNRDLEHLQDYGYAILQSALDQSIVDGLKAEVERLRLIHDFQGGLRNLADRSQDVAELARCETIREALVALNRSDAFLVRSILFDKTPGSNWKVAWHQDTKIPVEERHEIEGFTAWSTKDEIVHVQPPARILEDMITLRIHLDDTPKENGALKVAPKSHTKGFIPSAQISEWTKDEISCDCSAGTILAMSPLILHASSPSDLPSHRRVIHLEFATMELPLPLKWRSA